MGVDRLFVHSVRLYPVFYTTCIQLFPNKINHSANDTNWILNSF